MIKPKKSIKIELQNPTILEAQDDELVDVCIPEVFGEVKTFEGVVPGGGELRVKD